MKLQIERKYVDAMVDEFPGLSGLKDQLRFGNKAEVPFKQLSNTELSFLQILYKNAGDEMQGHAAQLSTLQKAMNDDTVRFEEDDLEMLLPACARYLINDAVRGWLFQANVAGKPMAYVVTRLDYTPSGEEETGRVTLELKANAKGKVAISTVTIRARDIADKTMTEIFAAKLMTMLPHDILNGVGSQEHNSLAKALGFMPKILRHRIGIPIGRVRM
jgi:hypothetical protein